MEPSSQQPQLAWVVHFRDFLLSSPIPGLKVVFEAPQRPGDCGYLLFSSFHFRKYLEARKLAHDLVTKHIACARNYLRKKQQKASSELYQTQRALAATVTAEAKKQPGQKKVEVRLFVLHEQVWERLNLPSGQPSGRPGSPPPEDEQPSTKVRKNNRGERRSAVHGTMHGTVSISSPPWSPPRSPRLPEVRTRFAKVTTDITTATQSVIALETIMASPELPSSVLEDLHSLRSLLESAYEITTRLAPYTISDTISSIPANPVSVSPSGTAPISAPPTSTTPPLSTSPPGSTTAPGPEEELDPSTKDDVGVARRELPFFFCPLEDLPDQATPWP